MTAGQSSGTVRNAHRRHALLLGGGAGTLAAREWELLLRALAAEDSKTKKQLRYANIAMQICAGATVASGAAQFVGSVNLQQSFRAVFVFSLGSTLLLLAYWLWLRKKTIAGRVAEFDVPLIAMIAQKHPAAPLYLACQTRNAEAGSPMLSGALGITTDLIWVFSLTPQADGQVVVEVGCGRHQGALGEDEASASVSGITRMRATEEAARGNPFTTIEMIALRQAHALQKQWGELDRFAAGENPMPVVDEVIGEDRFVVSEEALTANMVFARLQSL